MLNSVIDKYTSVFYCARSIRLYQGSYQNLNMTKSLQGVNNILFSFNNPDKILPQCTEKEQNLERLLQELSTAEKNCKGFRHLE